MLALRDPTPIALAPDRPRGPSLDNHVANTKDNQMPDKKPQHAAGTPPAKTLKQKRAAKREKQRADGTQTK